MKKVLFFIAAVGVMAACSPKNEPEQNSLKVTFDKATYFETLGTNTVPNVEGVNKDSAFIMDSVRADVVINNDTSLTINLYKIAFASAMAQRATIDMSIPGVKYTRSDASITLSGENITPMMGNREFPNYVITGLKGSITETEINFENNYGSYAGCTYVGKVTKMQ